MNGIVVSWVTAFAAGLLLVRSCIFAAPRFKFVAKPNPIIVTHTAPVAYGGGVAIALAMAVGLLLTPGTQDSDTFWWLLAGIPLLLCGLYDDIWPFNPGSKILAQSLAIAAAFLVSPLSINMMYTLSIMALSIIIVNGINFLDVSDGVVGSILFSSSTVLIIFYGDVLFSIVSGSTLAFLSFNWRPAKIYLGDAGSHFLAFMLVAMGVSLSTRAGAQPIDYLVAAGALGLLAIVELFYVSIVRILSRKSIFRGSSDHLPLHLQELGWSRPKVALSFGFTMTVITTLVQYYMNNKNAYIIISAIFIISLFCAWAGMSVFRARK